MNPAKSSNSKGYIVCCYWFFNHWLKFPENVYNGCHDLMILYLNISDTGIITVKGADYCCILYNIIKSEAIHLLKNYVLDDRGYI